VLAELSCIFVPFIPEGTCVVIIIIIIIIIVIIIIIIIRPRPTPNQGKPACPN